MKMVESGAKVPWVKTPLIWSHNLSEEAGCDIYLKLENVQPSGSFKSRGVGNFVLSHLSHNHSSILANGDVDHDEDGHAEKSSGHEPAATHFFCSSGGNAGLGCVHAAVTLGCPATIVVPLSTTAYMISKLEEAGAKEVVQKGDSWAEADEHLLKVVLPKARESGERPVYVPPFDAQQIWDGNATIVSEIFEQLRTVEDHYPTTKPTEESHSRTKSTHIPDAIICSVGGGGLMNGIMQGLDDHEAASTKVVAVETIGADSLSKSVAAGKLITLPAITSIATSLGARTVSKRTFEYALDKNRVRTAVLTDAEAVQGCKRFANEERIMVEPACGVSLAMCYTRKLRKLLPELQPSSRVVIVVCGGSNISLDTMAKYIKDFDA